MPIRKRNFIILTHLLATAWMLSAGAKDCRSQTISSTSDAAEANVSFKLRRSPTAKQISGILSVANQSVVYSVASKKESTLTCTDFLTGASVRTDKAVPALFLPSKWGNAAVWPDALEGLAPETILTRIRAECEHPGRARDLEYSDGISYPVAWMAYGQGRGRLKQSEGLASVNKFAVHLSDTKYSLRTSKISCSDLRSLVFRRTRDCKDCLVVENPGYAFRSVDKNVDSAALLEAIRGGCNGQEARHKQEMVEEALRAEKLRQEEFRRRTEEQARRLEAFQDSIRAAVQSAEELEPFSSFRQALDPSGPGGRYWTPKIDLSGASKCALLHTPLTISATASTWTLACIYTSGWPSPSDYGEVPMTNGVKSALGLSASQESNSINQFVFADPSKPNWRLYVGRIDDANIGISIVAFQGAKIANSNWFATAPRFLREEPRCQEYKQREDERNRRVADMKSLASQLGDLNRQFQAAIAKAVQADQAARLNCPAAAAGGFLGAINALGCIAAQTNSQDGRAEAGRLTSVIGEKQSEFTSAQLDLASTPPAVLLPGCRTDGTAIVAVQEPAQRPVEPGPTPPVSSPSATSPPAPPEPTVQEEIAKIRSNAHTPMPPAEVVVKRQPKGFGRVLMTIRNSTSYELSVFFDGPVSRSLTLKPGASRALDLAPGAFHVAGRVSAPDVLPFYGEESYTASAEYSISFYISTQ
jgi:hypothetical protein